MEKQPLVARIEIVSCQLCDGGKRPSEVRLFINGHRVMRGNTPYNYVPLTANTSSYKEEGDVIEREYNIYGITVQTSANRQSKTGSTIIVFDGGVNIAVDKVEVQNLQCSECKEKSERTSGQRLFDSALGIGRFTGQRGLTAVAPTAPVKSTAQVPYFSQYAPIAAGTPVYVDAATGRIMPVSEGKTPIGVSLGNNDVLLSGGIRARYPVTSVAQAIPQTMNPFDAAQAASRVSDRFLDYLGRPRIQFPAKEFSREVAFTQASHSLGKTLASHNALVDTVFQMFNADKPVQEPVFNEPWYKTKPRRSRPGLREAVDKDGTVAIDKLPGAPLARLAAKERVIAAKKARITSLTETRKGWGLTGYELNVEFEVPNHIPPADREKFMADALMRQLTNGKGLRMGR